MQRRQRAAAAAVSQRGAPGARRCTLAVRAAGDSGSAGAKGRTIELPIFPLNVVALPHATVPLMIFEPRCAPLWRCGVARCRAPACICGPLSSGAGPQHVLHQHAERLPHHTPTLYTPTTHTTTSQVPCLVQHAYGRRARHRGGPGAEGLPLRGHAALWDVLRRRKHGAHGDVSARAMATCRPGGCGAGARGVREHGPRGADPSCAGRQSARPPNPFSLTPAAGAARCASPSAFGRYPQGGHHA